MYLVPFILDEGPTAYVKLKEQEEQYKISRRGIIKCVLWSFGIIMLLAMLINLFLSITTFYNKKQAECVKRIEDI